MSGKEALELDSNRYLQRAAGAKALGEMASKVGTQEITLKDGRTLTVRGMKASYESLAQGAIPEPEEREGVTKADLASMKKTRAELVSAAMAAIAIVGYEVEIQPGKPATYDEPGGGDRAQARTMWIREAAWKLLDELHSTEIAHVISVSDALKTGDSNRLAALVADAGKGSSPTSKSSKPSADAGEKAPS